MAWSLRDRLYLRLILKTKAWATSELVVSVVFRRTDSIKMRWLLP